MLIATCRLKIEDMTVDDSGVYTCEGSNSFGKQATNGTVIVRKGRKKPLLKVTSVALCQCL